MKISDKTYAIDTNVILRYLLQDNDDLAPAANAIMEAVDDGKLSVSCDPVVLAEVVFVLGSFYKLSAEEIRVALSPIVKSDGVLIPNKDRYIRALELYVTAGIHYGDACACAAAMDECDGRLLSFDRKLSKVEGVRRLESM